MKRFVFRIAAALLLLSLTLSLLCSCAGLSGKYELRAGDTAALTLCFRQNGKLRIYRGRKEHGDKPVSVLFYQIKDGLFYSWEEDGGEQNAVGSPFSEGEDESGAYVQIGEDRYYKA